MSRVPWKEGKVVSVETRPGLFVLGQMVGYCDMLFFDSFRDSPDWPDTFVEELGTLFVVGVPSQFISHSNVKHQKHLRPAEFVYPDRWISPSYHGVFRTIWTGSPCEMTVGYTGARASLIDNKRQVIIKRIDPDDAETIDSYDRSALDTHPYLNDRLYLCHLLGRNVDVIKDLIFRRDLPIEYETFLRYIALTDDQIADLKPGSIEVDPETPGNQQPYSELEQRKKK